ncbi:Na+/H+ antiporter subunit A [Actinotalea sp.]|uniref:Na+/H+ antiporter subunit A n=1 Tax=Actinotalea sp. TaxID=1872145 RepID=UPI003564C9CE
MLLLLALHLLVSLVAPLVLRWSGRRGFLLLAIAPAAVVVWALAQTAAVTDGQGPTELVSWVPSLGIDLAFRLDSLSWLMVLLVGGIGAVVLVYSSAYFSPKAGGLGRFGAVLVAFAGSMLGVVTTDDLILLYVFWELTTVTSYLLIGHYADRKASRRAAMQAIVVTTAGGLAMLVGVLMIGHAAGTYRISAILADPPTGGAVGVAVVLLLAGAVTKSALVPFHFWLPSAMAAPTPVSAYLHAAAMVKAGVYLVARFAPAFADLTAWQVVVLGLGSATLLVGGYRSLRQYDLKLVLAFGTVSQLGLLIVLVGYGSQAVALAGIAMLGAHAMFKATLFLAVGVVDAATGTRDLRRLSGIGRALPITATAAGLATASMIGLPPFAGYVAKEAAIDALVHETTTAGRVVLAAVVLGSMLTVAYSLRFWWGAFAAKRVLPAAEPAAVPATGAGTESGPGVGGRALGSRGPAFPTDGALVTVVHRPARLLVAPVVLLGALGLLAGLAPAVGERVLGPWAATLPGEEGHLILWGGFTPALGLTVLVLAGGTALFVARSAVERWQARVPSPPDVDLLYRRSMRRLDDAAADVTAFTQRGSLPLYLGTILMVLVVGAGTALITGTTLPGWDGVRLWDMPIQAVAALVATVTAVLAARARRRLKAVVLTGISGFGVATIFLLHGAPDLALTQVLVETITLVVFVLVLRRLPSYFSVRPLAASRWVRLAVGVAVGLTVGAAALVMPSARTEAPVSVDFPVEAYEYGGGKNVVNVTLVDIRAWDTVGEISVLLVAATGVASLVFLRRRSGAVLRPSTAGGRTVWRVSADAMGPLRRAAAMQRKATSAAGGTGRQHSEWLSGGSTLAPERRSVIFEIATRLLFHTMVVFALFLLFSGHNAPGGGFAAGLVIGIALAVRYLAGGRYELGEAAPVHPGLLLGTGLFLSAGVGLFALPFGGSVLESRIFEVTVPVLGDVKLVTSLFFDIGVLLVVLGLVLDILRSLGAEIDRHQDGTADDDTEVERGGRASRRAGEEVSR